MLETLIPAAPTPAEVEAARVEHERLANAQAALAAKIAAVECEISRLTEVAQAAPDMTALVALAEAESLARIEGRELPKAHAAQAAQARQAAIGTQLQQQEAVALLPTMQARLDDLRGEYDGGRVAAIRAAQAYGDMRAIPVLREYAKRLNEAFRLESELEAINEEHGTRFSCGTRLRLPEGGDWLSRRDLEALAEQASGLHSA